MTTLKPAGQNFKLFDNEKNTLPVEAAAFLPIWIVTEITHPNNHNDITVLFSTQLPRQVIA